MQWGQFGNGPRLFLVVLLAVFCLYLPTYAHGEQTFILTEAEMMKLQEIFNGLQTENVSLLNDLQELRASYLEARTSLGEARKELSTANDSLTKAVASFEKSVQEQAATLSTVRTDALISKVAAGLFAAATLYLAIR